jgi:hypothetical protein
MKKVILSAVMVLALAGGSVFAATTQNKNAGGGKPAASAGKSGGKKHVRKHHRRGHKKSANKNM